VLIVASALKKVQKNNRAERFQQAALQAIGAESSLRNALVSLSPPRPPTNGGDDPHQSVERKLAHTVVFARSRGESAAQIATDRFATPNPYPDELFAETVSEALPAANGQSAAQQPQQPRSEPEARRPQETSTEELVERIAALSVQRALAAAKAAKKERHKCKQCGFSSAGCLCKLAPAPAPPRPEKVERELSQAELCAAAAASDDESTTDTTSEASSARSALGFSRAGRVATHSAQQLPQPPPHHPADERTVEKLLAAGWFEEAVLLNPALWGPRLRDKPSDEWVLERAMAQRWLTPRPGQSSVPAFALRNLAVDNLRFYTRLSGTNPPQLVINWALRNVDELETSLFKETGATDKELQEFRRHLSGQDRPSRYKKAWATKVGTRPPEKEPAKKKKPGGKKP
jgi:hypothetical protein